MKPAPFRYIAPETLDEALALLAEHGSEARPLAGGQSLVPAMNFRLARPAVLVDLNRIEALRFVRPRDDGSLSVGAMTTQRQAERDAAIAARWPLLREALPWVGHAQIRNRGTLGGSLAHADPAAEIPAVALASGVTLRLASNRGERRIAADDFFLGPMTSVLEPDELLVEIEFPAAPSRCGVAFEEVSRRHADFALAGVAASLQRADDGSVEEARVAVFGVGDRPRLVSAVARLQGERPTEAAIADTAAAAVAELNPHDDIHASACYRSHVAGVLVGRALRRAAGRAGGVP